MPRMTSRRLVALLATFAVTFGALWPLVSVALPKPALCRHGRSDAAGTARRTLVVPGVERAARGGRRHRSTRVFRSPTSAKPRTAALLIDR